MMTVVATPAGATLRRKVTASGLIWLAGRSYYISRRLAGQTVPVRICNGQLVVEAAIPLRKEYSLPRQAPAAPGRIQSWRAARRRS
jgi:hypothetical protein